MSRKRKKKRRSRGLVKSNLITIKPQAQTHHHNNCKMVYMNPWSISNKTTAIHDFITSNQVDVLAISESWMRGKENNKPEKIQHHEILPKSHHMIILPRPDGARGGGLAILYKKCFGVKILDYSKKKSDQFEYLVLSVAVNKSILRLILLYRPNPTKVNGLSVARFWEQFEEFLSKHICCTEELIITGDLNFHLEKPADTNTKHLISVLDEYGLKQKICEPTHVAGHTLDVLIVRSDCTSIESFLVVDPYLHNDEGKLIRDHYTRPIY